MLIDPSGKRKENLPHENEFRARRTNLSDSEYEAVVAEINAYCDTHSRVRTAYFDRGNWTTLREALERACHGDVEEADMFLGQILWLILRDRPEEWWFYRPPSIEGEIVGMSYERRD